MDWKNLRKEKIKASWDKTRNNIKCLKRTLTTDTSNDTIEAVRLSLQLWLGSTKRLMTWSLSQGHHRQRRRRSNMEARETRCDVNSHPNNTPGSGGNTDRLRGKTSDILSLVIFPNKWKKSKKTVVPTPWLDLTTTRLQPLERFAAFRSDFICTGALRTGLRAAASSRC